MRLREAVGDVWPHDVCLKCGSALVVRRRRDGRIPFLGCVRFPECDGVIGLVDCMRCDAQEAILQTAGLADVRKWDAGRLADGLVKVCDAWTACTGTSPGAEIVRRLIGAGHAPAGTAKGGRARTAGTVVRLGDSEEG